MSDTFDPYYKWLGIPPAEQPANHYRLLGIKLLEDDPDVIENAADRQMMHLRTMKTGKNGALSQKLLNEVSAAKLELLDPKRKAAYDKRVSVKRKSPARKPRKLKSAGDAAETADPATAVTPVAADLAPSVTNSSPKGVTYRKSRKNKKSSHSSQLLIGGMIAAVLAVVLIAVATMEREPAGPVAHKQQRLVTKKSPSTVSPTSNANSSDEDARRERKRRKRRSRDSQAPGQGGKEGFPELPEFSLPEEAPEESDPGESSDPSPTESEPPSEEHPREELPSEADPQPEVARREPLPLEEQQQKAAARVREVFQVQQARTSEQKVELAKNMIRQSGRPDSASERFALLDEARSLAVEGTDFELAVQAAEALGKAFQIDPFTLAAESLAAIRIPISELDRNQQLVSLGIEWMQRAAELENYEGALNLGETAATTARRIRDLELAKHIGTQVSNFREAQKSYQRALDAQAILKSDPDNKTALLDLGKHLCLYRSDWERGLPHLARGSDSRLQAIAQADLEASSDVEQQTSVAEAWAEAAKRASGTERISLTARAEFWYRKVLPQLSGVEKIAVEKRLREIGPVGDSQTFRRSAPTRGLVAHWEFDKGKGTVASDSVGQGHGRLEGPVWSEGVLKGGLRFDGKDDSVLVPRLGILQAFTLALWLRPAESDGENPIFGNNEWNLGDVHLTLSRTGEVTFTVRGSLGKKLQIGLFKVSSQGRIQTGSWRHIAITYDVASRTSMMYLDGAYDSTHSYHLALPVQFGPGRMGGWVSRKRSRFYAGEMDDLRIYNRVLDAEEIATLSESASAR